MRSVLAALVLLAVGAPGARTQENAWANKLFGGATTHDFGNVPRGALLVHRFPLHNIYAVDLEILSVRTSCGCVSARSAARLVRSKEDSYIEVTMDARKFTGPKAVSVYVSVGPNYTSTATLQVSANSRADVVFNPGEVKFGVVPRGQTARQTIDVEYAGTYNWQVTGVVLDNVPLEVTYQELYRRPGQVGYRVTVQLKGDAPPGLFKGQFQLRTNDKVSQLLPVAVEANIQSPLSVAPEVVAMEGIAVNEARTQQVILRGSKPFRIVAIDGQGDGISAVLPTKKAAVHFLTIQCKPTRAGNLSRKLTIRTDLDTETTATVTVEANVVP